MTLAGLVLTCLLGFLRSRHDLGLEILALRQVRKPKSVGAQFVELILNTAAQTKNLCVGVNQGSPNYNHTARTGTLHAAALVHQYRCIAERFRNHDCLTFPEVQMEGSPQGCHVLRAGSFGDTDPIAESSLYRFGDRVVGAAFHNLTLYSGRHYHGVVDHAE